jgi:predicted NBD/HSP70 family sugar kinase
LKDSVVLIGVDGGASKTTAWSLNYDEREGGFSLGKYHSSCAYAEIEGFLADFTPLVIPRQLKEREEGSIELTQEEIQQANTYVEACCRVIRSVAAQSKGQRFVIGLGMPGLKTDDKRGIEVLANGPRIPDFSEQVEKNLAQAGIQLHIPIAHLGSDADYCGIGENFATEGLFKEVDNAYYLGGGTGVADALKLKGNLLPLDRCKSWMAKTWEMKSPDGLSLERYTSMGGLQALYADISGSDVATLNTHSIYPLQIAEKAEKGEKAARKVMEIAVEHLSALVYERVLTLYAGSRNALAFVNPNREQLSGEHPYLKGVFERIIIGQRLGELFASSPGSKQLREPFIDRLQQMIQRSDDLGLDAKRHYQQVDAIIHSSRLREAPALGAGIDAFFSWKGLEKD